MALSVLPAIAETGTVDLFAELQLLFAAESEPDPAVGAPPGHPESDRLPPPGRDNAASRPEDLPGEPVDTSKARPGLTESAGLSRMAWAAS